MVLTSVFETQWLTVKELWNNNIRKPSEIIKITGYPKSTVYDIINRLKKQEILSTYLFLAVLLFLLLKNADILVVSLKMIMQQLQL
jgi:hypothetical protein